MANRTSQSRLAIVFVAVVVVALAAFFGIRAIVHVAEQTFSSPHCDVGSYELDTDQASVAAAMVGEVTRFRPTKPARAAVLTLAAGLQESKLTNLAPGAGDRDSVGVLQQRPSQGWGGGDASKLTDVTEATREFLAALVEVKHWEKRPLADAIQAVQISADGTAYAKHEPEAQALAAALQGRKAAGISCTFDKPTKVATTTKVIAQLRHELPVKRPRAHGRSIAVPGASWQTVAWFVANADRLGIDSVRYGTRVWSREDGWHKSRAAIADVEATMARL
jgi:hypothetical protein